MYVLQCPNLHRIHINALIHLDLPQCLGDLTRAVRLVDVYCIPLGPMYMYVSMYVLSIKDTKEKSVYSLNCPFEAQVRLGIVNST